MAEAAGGRGAWVLATKLFSASIFAQGASLVATTVAALRLEPADFARFGVVVAASAVVASVNSLATQTRIPVVGSATASGLSRVGLSAALVCSVAIAIAGASAFILSAQTAVIVLLCALGSGCLAASSVMTALAVRASRQELLARSRVGQALINAILISILIFTPLPGYLALGLAWVVSLVVGAGVVTWGVRDFRAGISLARAGDWGMALREVRSQPLNNLLASLSTAWPALLLPALGAQVLAGIWAVLGRVLNAVVSIVFLTAGPIYLGAASRLIRAGDASGMATSHKRWALRLLLLLPVTAAGVWVGFVFLFPLLGDQWDGAEQALVPTLIYFSCFIVWLPLSQTLIILRRTDKEMMWSVLSVIAGGAALASIPWVGGVVALTAWSIVQAVAMGCHFYLQRRAIWALGRGPEGDGKVSS